MTTENRIYLDNAATTALYPEVLQKMLPYFCEEYGNASGICQFGGMARKGLEEARRILAESLQAEPGEIYFTAGGSEADNWALIGAAEMYVQMQRGEAGEVQPACRTTPGTAGGTQAPRGDLSGHIITTRIEHHAVLHTCAYLEKRGVEVTYLDVDQEGVVDIKQLEEAIRPDTFLISVMFANNEVGTLQPIQEIGEIAGRHHILFHSDGVQAYGHVPVDVKKLGIDLLSVSGHKFHGPKGIGFLYIRKGIRLGSFMHGGAQERGRRAGTVNVPGAVGMGAAAALMQEQMQENTKRVTALRDYLINRIEQEIPDVLLNGHRQKRLPNNVNFCFAGVQGESVLIQLDMKNICASSGSACTSGSLDPSHVLLALGRTPEEANSSIRLTLSELTTEEELDRTVEALKEIIARLRSMRYL